VDLFFHQGRTVRQNKNQHEGVDKNPRNTGDGRISVTIKTRTT
jgi:hypothetical protein